MNTPIDTTTAETLRPEALTDVVVAKKMMQLHQSAESRGLEFSLSFRTVKELLSRKKCYYTGDVFQDGGACARSIDRVDTSKGYVEGNVVACTVEINGKKSNLTVEEILTMAEKIKRHLRKK